MKNQITERHCQKCKALRASGTRHCMACGHTPAMPLEDQLRLGLIRRHKKLEPEDGQLVIDTLEEYGLTLPQNAIQWRVAGRRNPDGSFQLFIKGKHSILTGSVTCILTDGVVAWFILGDGETPFFGHLSNFEPEKQERPETKRQALLRHAYEED